MNLPASPEIRALRHNPRLKPWDYIPGLLYKPWKVFAAIRLRGPRVWDWLIPAVLFGVSLALIYLFSTNIDLPVKQLPGLSDYLYAVFYGLAMLLISPAIVAVALFVVSHFFGLKRLGFKESLSISGSWMYILLVIYIIKISLKMYFGISVSTDPAHWLGLDGYWFISLILGIFQPTNVYFIILGSIGVLYLGRTSRKRAILVPLVTFAVLTIAYIIPSIPMFMTDLMVWILAS